MTRFKGVGIHVFAGGFTAGVQQVMDVDHQLEVHGFGLETAEHMCKIKCINSPAKDWPDVTADFAYGNPRCTGFSTITSGYDDTIHGPWAKCTCDIHEFSNYVAGRYPIAIWESVQQAYTVGKPLLDYLRDNIFEPKGYRIAHLFVNAASTGNSQLRKRYFFVAYHGDRNFNITPPDLPQHQTFVWDAIHHLEDMCDGEGSGPYQHCRLSPNEWDLAHKLNYGYSVNSFLKFRYKDAPKRLREVWDLRTSSLPFSLHCLYRTSYCLPCPTMSSSAARFLHPTRPRPFTNIELATLMGWPTHSLGKNPSAEIAKGVVPSTGAWLAQQAEHYLNDAWGDEDWESSYNSVTATWEGRSTEGALEKKFNLTSYIPPWRSHEDYPKSCFVPEYLRPVGHDPKRLKYVHRE